MPSLRLLVLAGVATLVVTAPASAATPAKLLAATLKPSMQHYYDAHDPGLEITAVTCSLNAAETSAHCTARFTVTPEKLTGVFGLDATIDRTTGGVTTKTVSDRCTSVTTHKRVTCDL
jgi:hypothetical protein